jgi:hypothetical protein
MLPTKNQDEQLLFLTDMLLLCGFILQLLWRQSGVTIKLSVTVMVSLVLIGLERGIFLIFPNICELGMV